MALLGDRESRLLIDGELVAGSGGTFPTINPATEEVLGVAADATADARARHIRISSPFSVSVSGAVCLPFLRTLRTL